jgi:hypothetical protein
VFLGTPHKGAYGDYANFGVILQRMTGLFLHDSNRHLISSLKDDSETLSRVSESFARMLDSPPFVTYSFVEELPMTTVKGIGLVSFSLVLL